MFKKIFESKEYLKSKLDESELRNSLLIDKLAIALTEIDDLQKETYRLKEEAKCYREQLKNENITPKSVAPNFGKKYLEYITLKNSRINDEKVELFRQMIIEAGY